MLNLISNYIPKTFLPLAYLGIGFAVIVISMFLASRIGKIIEKKKKTKSSHKEETSDPAEIKNQPDE